MLSSADGGASWLQAVSLSDGSSVWQGEPVAGVVFERVEVAGSRLLVADADASALLAFDRATGALLWRRAGAHSRQ